MLRLSIRVPYALRLSQRVLVLLRLSIRVPYELRLSQRVLVLLRLRLRREGFVET